MATTKQTARSNTDAVKLQTDTKSTTPIDPTTFISRVTRGEFSREQVVELLRQHPTLATVTAETIRAQAAIIEAAGQSQQNSIQVVLEHIKGSTDVLKLLASRAQSDETREHIANVVLECSKLSIPLAGEMGQMNAENNSFWKRNSSVILGILCVIVGSTLVAYGKSDQAKTEA